MTTTEPTTEEDALWASVGEMPECQLQRGVAADWYEERSGKVECPNCAPPRAFPPYAWKCHTCHGTGRTPGVLGELLRREPLTVAGIEVSDREPAQPQIGGRFMWAIDELEIGPRPCRIPSDLFTVMEEVAGELGANVLEFPTADAARLALGEALFRLHGPKSEVTT